MSDYLGWIANICLAVGIYRIGKKDKGGFVWQLVGNFFYLMVGFSLQLSSFIGMALLLACLNFFGFLEWTKVSVLND